MALLALPSTIRIFFWTHFTCFASHVSASCLSSLIYVHSHPVVIHIAAFIMGNQLEARGSLLVIIIIDLNICLCL